ncbi:site-specific DNA-methyltransferase [Ruficoccus amylovorans]|uniref:Methyltransferase n=1 Tax=Ruficoccus amylovorans TaxID=1804625 RepID=A0A842HEN6_9BACT|nr:site-specific DNA-methyltransferase [Ruficoccus amylovorans]MBC2594892.1 site-specific DNA-methyltransferase [Ruficoccus amylovorans]
MNPLTILTGDNTQTLRQIPDSSVRCVVTSPPYWALRDYGIPPTDWPEVTFVPVAGLPPVTIPAMSSCLGLEQDPWAFVGHMVAVFREVKRVLADDGTCWVNMGDSYNTGVLAHATLRPKDMVGIPWRVAQALQADGWILRQDIIWEKPSPMPESVRDRCTKAHEYLFLLAKSPRYYWHAEAMKEPVSGGANPRGKGLHPKVNGWATGDTPHNALEHNKPGGSYKGSIPGRNGGPGQERRSKRPRQNASFSAAVCDLVETRNKRSVWTIPSQPFPEAHFATYPEALPRLCILAGTQPGDTVLDPFGGSGTTGKVALELGRKAILCEINPEYVKMTEARTNTTLGLGI